MKHHDIVRIRPKKKAKKLTAFEQSVIGLNIDMANAKNINIRNKYE